MTYIIFVTYTDFIFNINKLDIVVLIAANERGILLCLRRIKLTFPNQNENFWVEEIIWYN